MDTQKRSQFDRNHGAANFEIWHSYVVTYPAGYENRRSKRAQRSRTRYLTSEGRIVAGKELFRLSSGVTVHALELIHTVGFPSFQNAFKTILKLRPEQRRKFFRSEKAWVPSWNK